MECEEGAFFTKMIAQNKEDFFKNKEGICHRGKYHFVLR